MLISELVETFPKVYHMAEPEAWPSIRRHGLLSTLAILDLVGVEESLRHEILTKRRPRAIEFTDGAHGHFTIRDQIPLTESKLRGALTEMSVRQWLELLNSKVFFWPTEQRVKRLLSAKAYRNREHLVFVVDSARLVAQHGEQVSLSPINTGATEPFAAPRGPETIRRIDDYPFEERRRVTRTRRKAVAELLVDYAVPDLEELTIEIVRASTGSWKVIPWT